MMKLPALLEMVGDMFGRYSIVIVVNTEEYHETEQIGRVFVKFHDPIELDNFMLCSIAEGQGAIRIKDSAHPRSQDCGDTFHIIFPYAK